MKKEAIKAVMNLDTSPVTKAAKGNGKKMQNSEIVKDLKDYANKNVKGILEGI